MKYDYSEYALVFKALSDPTRIKIVDLLSNFKDKCDCGIELLKHLNVTQPTLSYHMKFLIESGLVTETKEGTFKRYKFSAEKFSDVHHFIMNMDQISQENKGGS